MEEAEKLNIIKAVQVLVNLYLNLDEPVG